MTTIDPHEFERLAANLRAADRIRRNAFAAVTRAQNELSAADELCRAARGQLDALINAALALPR